jgi:hypothetical protein
MLSRKLISAVVALLTGCFVSPAGAQNLEAGKTPSQIFSQTCSLCHKSSRGLLKTVPPGSLAGFLRQHYTTSTDMAAMLSAYVLSNGATDARHGGDNLTKQGKEAQAGAGPELVPPENKPSGGFFGRLFDRRTFESRPSEPKPSEPRSSEPKAAEARPAEARPASAEAKPEPKPKFERRSREASRPDVDNLENVPGAEPPEGAEAAHGEAEPKGKKSKFDKKKPGIATAKQEPKVEPPASPAPPDTAKSEAKVDVKGEPQIRPDPVPAVTPAPAEPDASTKTAEQRPSNLPVFNLEPQPPQAEAAVVPPRPPAGPPVVPISQ